MKFTATAKGPGLTLMVCVGLQSMIDACLEWGEKTWTIADGTGTQILQVPASIPVQRELFE